MPNQRAIDLGITQNFVSTQLKSFNFDSFSYVVTDIEVDEYNQVVLVCTKFYDNSIVRFAEYELNGVNELVSVFRDVHKAINEAKERAKQTAVAKRTKRLQSNVVRDSGGATSLHLTPETIVRDNEGGGGAKGPGKKTISVDSTPFTGVSQGTFSASSQPQRIGGGGGARTRNRPGTVSYALLTSPYDADDSLEGYQKIEVKPRNPKKYKRSFGRGTAKQFTKNIPFGKSDGESFSHL